jgi:hypothetical protein
MPASIFFSHSTADLLWCEWLAVEARNLGIEPYLAEHDERPGNQLASKVEHNIDRCDAFVVLLTDNTAESTYVHQEIGYARKAKKLIIPLVQRGVGRKQLSMLEGVEYIDFDFQNPHAGKGDFATALQRLATRQNKQDQVETLIALGACVALIVLLLSGDGGAPTAAAA